MWIVRGGVVCFLKYTFKSCLVPITAGCKSKENLQVLIRAFGKTLRNWGNSVNPIIFPAIPCPSFCSYSGDNYAPIAGLIIFWKVPETNSGVSRLKLKMMMALQHCWVRQKSHALQVKQNTFVCTRGCMCVLMYKFGEYVLALVLLSTSKLSNVQYLHSILYI